MIVRVKAQEIIDQNEKLSAVGYFVSKAYESCFLAFAMIPV